MTEKLSVFGSYGLQNAPRVFGLKNPAAGPVEDRPTPPFGRRRKMLPLSLHRTRLLQLRSELQALFQDAAFPGEMPSFEIVDGTTPRLLIGSRGLVVIEAETGQLVFVEKTANSETTVITANDERLLDHILCHLASDAPNETPRIASAAAKTLVGQTLEEIERHVILQTLRHCHGNRTRTARMLGISLRTVRNKLRSYWIDRTGQEAGA